MKFAITGITGHTGKVAAEALIAAGHEVRAVVRDAAKGEAWAAKGAEVAIADVLDADGLARAISGVDGVYLLLPPRLAPGFRAYQTEAGRSIAAAVRQALPKHVVFLSSVGAQHTAGTGPIAGLHPVEQALRAHAEEHPGFAATLLRAGYFMENVASSLGGLEHGVLPGFVPADLPIDMIATKDIGRVAAELLAEGGDGVQVVELGGPGVTMNDAAAACARITGKPIAAIQVPLEQMVPTLTGYGFPEDVAQLYAEMTAGLAKGLVAWEGTGRRVHGTTSIDEVLSGLLGR
jgi:uncharacterized protein YbjT (DUF2867 family)